MDTSTTSVTAERNESDTVSAGTSKDLRTSDPNPDVGQYNCDGEESDG